MKFQYKNRSQVFQILGIFFLAILFSTNYYGGNALYFLTSETQYIIKVVAGAGGAISLFIYLALRNKNKRDLIEKHGYLYTREASEYMVEKNISMDNVESAILHGKRKQRHSNVWCTWETEEGLFIIVVLNDQGHVLSIST